MEDALTMTKFALNRPVTVLMIFLAVVLLGFVSWQRLPLELLPSINYPEITVLTTYENVAPPEIESLITKPIEEAVGTVPGVRKVTSRSMEGLSLVTLSFEWGVDTNVAGLDVREKLETVRESLPRDSENPMIIKFDPGAFPIMTLGISGSGSLPELARIASEEIKQKLERVPGIALARISGGVEREILVAVDQARLFAYGIPLSTIVERLKEANFNFPGGSIEKGKTELRIRTLGQFESLSDMENVVISKGQGRAPVFLRDVARVEDSFKDRTSSFVINGQSSVGISLFKQSDSNTVKVAEDVLKTVATLQESLGTRARIAVVYNQATFISDAIRDLELAGILGGALAFIVLLLFLHSVASALIITTAIPVSVLGAFMLMYATGVSLNIMSLGGLALGVGMLVDNGIVILENIHRRREKAQTLYEAALEGSQEMKNPVLASTLAHVIVFVPILFVKGLAGKFLGQLAFTISFSLLISIFVALMLNPMLEARRLRNRHKHRAPAETQNEPSVLTSPAGRSVGLVEKVMGPLWNRMDEVMAGINRLYSRLLALSLSHRKKVVVLTVLLLSLSVGMVPFLGTEFLPNVDQGSFVLQVTTKPGSTLESTEATAAEIQRLLSADRDVENVFVSIGYDRKEKMEKALGGLEGNIARITVTLKQGRARSLQEIVAAIRPRLSQIDGAEIEYVLNQDVTQLLRQKQTAPEILEVRGADLGTIRSLTEEIIQKIKRVKGLEDVQSSVQAEAPELQLVVDRQKAARYQLTIKDVADAVKTAMEGRAATTYREEDQEVDITVRLQDKDRKSVSDLERVIIHTPSKSDIPLKEVAEIKRGVRLREIERRDLNRVAVISGNPSGTSFGQVMEKVKGTLKGIRLPSDHYVVFSEQQEEMDQSFRNLAFALSLSVLFVYMLLASLFESLMYPFIILFAVPLAVVGVFLILFFTGTSISLGVYIGAIMLGGIVVNNSIILVDYMNTLRKRGIPRMEAIVEGGKARLRPILMTAITTILGLLPLAVGLGRGSEIRVPLALTVIGGLTTSTFMTLIVVPVVYSMIEDLRGSHSH